MIEKTGVIGGLDLPEKAEHTKENRRIHSSQDASGGVKKY